MKKIFAKTISVLTALFIVFSVLPVHAAEPTLTYEELNLLLGAAASFDLLYDTVHSSWTVFDFMREYYMTTSPWAEEMYAVYPDSIEIPAATCEALLNEYFDFRDPEEMPALIKEIRENHSHYDPETNCYKFGYGGFGDIGSTFVGYQQSGDEYSFWFLQGAYSEEEDRIITTDHGKVFVLKLVNGHECFVDSYKIEAKDLPSSFAPYPDFVSPALGDTEIPEDEGVIFDYARVFSGEYFKDNTNIYLTLCLPERAADFKFPEYALGDGQEQLIYVSVSALSGEEEVQPEKPLPLTFSIPDDFSNNVSFFRLEEGKEPTEMPLTTDWANRTVTVTFDHFSNYILVSGSPIAGDVDGDKTVSSADARLALRAAVKLENIPAGAVFEAADVTGNGQIDPEDARLILRASVGLETIGK